MFFIRDVKVTDDDIITKTEIKVPPGAKYRLEEGTCSRIVTKGTYYVHWLDKIDQTDVVCTANMDGNCIVNTAHPVYIINNRTTEIMSATIYDLNNVIEHYRKLL